MKKLYFKIVGFLNEDFLWRVAEKSWAEVFVCVCACLSKYFRFWRPNGWSHRERVGTIRCAGPERRNDDGTGPRSPLALPRATASTLAFFLATATAQTGGSADPKLSGHIGPDPT